MRFAKIAFAIHVAHAVWGLQRIGELFPLQASWIGDPRMQSGLYSTRKPLPCQNFIRGDLLDVVGRLHFATNSSRGTFVMQEIFHASGTNQNQLWRIGDVRDQRDDEGVMRHQSKQGPGSVFRSGAMSECPAMSVIG